VVADPPGGQTREELAEATMRTFTSPAAPGIRVTISQLASSSPTASLPEAASCPVCLEALVEDVVVLPCRHTLHGPCARQLVLQGLSGPLCLKCPECQALHGTRTGDQPPGSMSWSRVPGSLAGHPGCGSLVVTYRLEGGQQGPEHPSPGRPYTAHGFPRTAYLPDSGQGRTVLRLLAVAFRRRLLFTDGRSLTSGRDDCVTWAGVHHKTALGGEHGFPDIGYLDRVTAELRERGVTEDDMDNHKNMEKKIERKG
jgi:deltex-like protein